VAAPPHDLQHAGQEECPLLHQAGRHDTTESTRWASRYIDQPFASDSHHDLETAVDSPRLRDYRATRR
jgi:hypothetical protein